MSDTNDKQANGYTVTFQGVQQPVTHDVELTGADEIRDFYEAKIASGELMVVKTIKRSELNEHIRTVHDISWDAAGSKWVTHCAGCGAKIINP